MIGRRVGLAVAAVLFSLAIPAWGQRELYPKHQGAVRQFALDALPHWLSFTGELRSRTEGQTALNLLPGNGRVYDLTRARGAVVIAPAKWFKGQIQFQDTHALGLTVRNVPANQRDTFDFLETYAGLTYKQSELIVGRQFLRFGDERVVGTSDWTNNARSWDGADLRIGGTNRLELFTTSVVQVHPTSLDTHGAGLTFHGAIGRLAWGRVGEEAVSTATTFRPQQGNANPPRSSFSVQPFAIVRALPRVRSQEGHFGSETETTFGAYWEGALPYGIVTSGTGDLQRGSYSEDSIHAGAGIVRGGWVAREEPWKPHIEGEYDYATGNPGKNIHRVSTYDQQYPSNHNAFGLVDLFGFQNLKQDRLNLSATPLAEENRNLQVLFQVGSLHLATARNSVYGGTGAVLVTAPAGGFRGDGLGTEFDASAKYIWHQVYVANIGVGHLFPGVALGSTGRAPLTLAYLQLTYRWKVSGK